jgi:hypothetical protein
MTKAKSVKVLDYELNDDKLTLRMEITLPEKVDKTATLLNASIYGNISLRKSIRIFPILHRKTFLTTTRFELTKHELNNDKLIVHVETELSKDVLQYVNKKGVELIIEIFGDFDLADLHPR